VLSILLEEGDLKRFHLSVRNLEEIGNAGVKIFHYAAFENLK
jgi:hypothetical protein